MISFKQEELKQDIRDILRYMNDIERSHVTHLHAVDCPNLNLNRIKPKTFTQTTALERLLSRKSKRDILMRIKTFGWPFSKELWDNF